MSSMSVPASRFSFSMGVPAVVVLEARQFGVGVALLAEDGHVVPVAHFVPLANPDDELVVLGGHRCVVEVGQLLQAKRKETALLILEVLPDVLPALRTVARRQEELAVLAGDGVVHEQPDLRAQQLQVAEVAGEQEGAFGGDGETGEHDVVADETVPAVEPAPPQAPAVFADLARGAHVVGQDAAVGLDALHPRPGVVEHPAFVFFLAGVEGRRW